jgi:ferric-dicitrate binding protein FerR (iron transport regulator)
MPRETLTPGQLWQQEADAAAKKKAFSEEEFLEWYSDRLELESAGYRRALARIARGEPDPQQVAKAALEHWLDHFGDEP